MTRHPAASRRFHPTRAGIVNLWDYADQEFSFADGRLVLRGPNGSGKTKALEVLFPFVLDGRIEPRRLNPFAGEERTMRSNLLYRQQDSAHGYVWMEFGRGPSDDPEAVTVGIGMRASKGTDRVARWYFVVDGRVGVDFSLIGADDRPFTRKQLIEEIGSDAVVDRPIDYRAAIDARLFGLGAERYDQLITLILTLRRPQLAKNLDPRGLSRALSDGLRPLDEHLVTEAARSFSDMEEVGRALESLVRIDTAAGRFTEIYRRYLTGRAAADVARVTARMTAVDHARVAVHAARALGETRARERAEAEERLVAADVALDRVLAERETLQGSAAYESKRQIEDLADAVRRLEVSTGQQAQRAERARAAVAQRLDDHRSVRDAVSRSAADTSRAATELAVAAEDAGIAWTDLPDGAGSDRITLAVRGHVEERAGDLRALRTAAAAVERAGHEVERADQAANRSSDRFERASTDLAAARADIGVLRSRWEDSLRRWWIDHRDIYQPLDTADLPARLVAASAAIGDPDVAQPAAVLNDAVAASREDLRATIARVRAEQRALRAEADRLRAERSAIEAEHDDAPPPSPIRAPGCGVPLWRTVRFVDGIDPIEAAAIEAALQAADLLDAEVSGADVWCADVWDADAHRLRPVAAGHRPTGPTLADVLEPEESAPIDANSVAAVLRSIALRHDAGRAEAVVAIGVDGSFGNGVACGRHRKDRVEFIGATARADRRAARLAEVDESIGGIDGDLVDRRATEQRCVAMLERLSAGAAALPKTTDIVTALRAEVEAAGALRSTTEHTDAATGDVERATEARTAALRTLHTVAAQHRITLRPYDTGSGIDDAAGAAGGTDPAGAAGAAIDLLAANLRHVENAGAALARARVDHERALERDREGAERVAEAQTLAAEYQEEAEIARTGYEQQLVKLETLREALGADSDRIDAELDRVRLAIEQARADQKSARRADREAGEAVGVAEGAVATAAAGLRAAITELLADAPTLRPYGRTDIGALVGLPPGTTWPADDAAWSSVEQIAYRVEAAAGPDDPIEILPREAADVLAALTAATTGAPSSEAALKSGRTALTAALQDFDAELAGAGGGYRLVWDAVDHVTVVRIHGEEGAVSIARFAEHIAGARRDQEVLLTEAERRVLEDALLTGLARQIHERVGDARELISRMGSEMKTRRMSSGATVGVHWVLADGQSERARTVGRLLDRDAADLSTDDLAQIRSHFAEEIRTARAAHPEQSYREILTGTLDYRRWRYFAFSLIAADGTEERLTVARHGALSGGEQSVSLHLPLFAAAHVMLSSADPHAPRLLGLDEAFAGVDDNGRRELLGLSVTFDLDLFMTGYDLWVAYAEVPGCAHYALSHSAAEHVVDAALIVWDGGTLWDEPRNGDLVTALGSPGTRRVLRPVVGGLDFAQV